MTSLNAIPESVLGIIATPYGGVNLRQRIERKGVIMISLEIPGRTGLEIQNLLMDFNGTLAVDGILIDGVEMRLRQLSSLVKLVILTADTFGRVTESCTGLPVEIVKVREGHEAIQKKGIIEGMGRKRSAAIGNGANDIQMLEIACLSIVILGREGICTRVLGAADICVPDICSGLDLFLSPKRIAATLRE